MNMLSLSQVLERIERLSRGEGKYDHILLNSVETLYDQPENKKRIEAQLNKCGIFENFTHEYGKYLMRGMELEKQLVSVADIEEKEQEFLIPDYVPKGAITILAGEGGIGKTSVWCAVAAAVSSGKAPFMIQPEILPGGWYKAEPQKVLVFSGEDTFEYVLKEKLRKNGAALENIQTIRTSDEKFTDIKFNSEYLHDLLAYTHPGLCIFDPIQSFIPPVFRMAERNAIRQCLQPLIGIGESVGTTFIIVVHANKQSGVWGRKRIADSSDIWDIARSVLMVGETNEPGIRYLTQEKSNYRRQGETVLFENQDDEIVFRGYTHQKDQDFVQDRDYSIRQAPARDEAKVFIREFLKDGEKSVSELDGMAKAQGITDSALRRAKTELKQDGEMILISRGYGRSKQFFASLAKK